MSRSTTGIAAEDFARVGKLVSAWRSPLLLSHTNPDGDALGCLGKEILRWQFTHKTGQALLDLNRFRAD